MRAVTWQSGTFCVSEVPTPKYKENEVLLQVEAASINRADYAGPAFTQKNGKIPCSDVVGRVVLVGAQVKGFAVGDRVCAVLPSLAGGLAEYAVAKPSWMAPVPENMDIAMGSVVPTAGITAFAAVEKVHLDAGDELLVCGASGGVGQCAVVLARDKGAIVTAACSAKNKEMVLGCGAQDFFDYSSGLVGLPTNRFDAVLAVNGSFAPKDYFSLLKPGGKLVLVGGSSISPGALLAPVYGKKLGVALFFTQINSTHLESVARELSASPYKPFLETVHGFEEGAVMLNGLLQERARGKNVIMLG